MDRSRPLLEGSRRESRLVVAVSIGFLVLVPATVFLVADTAAAVLLTGASVVAAVVALFVRGTVADEVRLTFRPVPYRRGARGTGAWTDAAGHEGGHGRLVRRDCRPQAVAG